MKNNIFLKILLILFIVFLALYYSSNAGIIDYEARNKKLLTDKQILEFEEDIKNNEKIDIKKYIDTDNEKYNSFLSKMTLKVSNKLGNTVNDVLNIIFDNFEVALKK